MAVFLKGIGQLPEDPRRAARELQDHIGYMQERLEFNDSVLRKRAAGDRAALEALTQTADGLRERLAALEAALPLLEARTAVLEAENRALRARVDALEQAAAAQ